MAAAKNTSVVRPSIHSVAAYAGVSIATVSKVMQGDKTVRAENVKSVQNAIEALGYRINPLAADLRRGRRKLVGVIVPTYDDPLLCLAGRSAGAAGRNPRPRTKRRCAWRTTWSSSCKRRCQAPISRLCRRPPVA